MLNLIQLKHGLEISQRVSEQFVAGAREEQRRPPVRAASGPGRQLPPQHDPGRRAHGGEHREAAVARGHRAHDRPLPAADRAAVPAPPRLRAEALLPRDAPAPRPRTPAADGHADHGRHDLLRLQVPAPFLPLLPGPVRPSPERGAAASANKPRPCVPVPVGLVVQRTMFLSQNGHVPARACP